MNKDLKENLVTDIKTFVSTNYYNIKYSNLKDNDISYVNNMFYNAINNVNIILNWYDSTIIINDFFKYIIFCTIYNKVPTIAGFCFYSNTCTRYFNTIKDITNLKDAYVLVHGFLQDVYSNTAVSKQGANFGIYMLNRYHQVEAQNEAMDGREENSLIEATDSELLEKYNMLLASGEIKDFTWKTKKPEATKKLTE